MLKIYSNKKVILYSGSVSTFDENGDVSFVLPLGENDGTVQFYFKDTDDSKLGVKMDQDTNKDSITLTFENFNSSLGSGNKKPAPIGTINDKKIWISYWITSIGETKRKLINYTFYGEK